LWRGAPPIRFSVWLHPSSSLLLPSLLHVFQKFGEQIVFFGLAGSRLLPEKCRLLGPKLALSYSSGYFSRRRRVQRVAGRVLAHDVTLVKLDEILAGKRVGKVDFLQPPLDLVGVEVGVREEGLSWGRVSRLGPQRISCLFLRESARPVVCSKALVQVWIDL